MFLLFPILIDSDFHCLVPDYEHILDDLERGAVTFLNSEKGPILACKVLAHFKNDKNMGKINSKDQKFVKKLIEDLEFRMHLGVSNDTFYMEVDCNKNYSFLRILVTFLSVVY